MFFLKALSISFVLHIFIALGFVMRLPSIEVSVRPETRFIGGVLRLHDVVPYIGKHQHKRNVSEHLPEWNNDITYRRWLHQQQVQKKITDKSIGYTKKQYKSDINEFKVILDEVDSFNEDSLGVDFSPSFRTPLKLPE